MAKILGVSVLDATGYKLKFDKYFKEFNSTDNYHVMVQCLSGMYKVMRSYGDASFSGQTTYLYERFRDKVMAVGRCSDLSQMSDTQNLLIL